MYQLIFGFFKDKRYPMCIKVIMGICLVGMFFAVLPKSLPICYALLLACLYTAIAVIAGGVLLVFPIFTVASALLDILFGKKLKNYKQNDNLKYHLPAFTYCFSAMLIILIGTYSESRFVLFDYRKNDYLALCHTILLYVGVSAIYVLVFYLGMWRRISHIDKGKYYIEILNKHSKFLKLSFIPISFLITLLSVMTAFGDINISLVMILEFLNNILAGAKDNLLQSSLTFIGLLYIFSIPIQLVALFINATFKYFFEEGKYYKQMCKKFAMVIYHIVK